MSDDTTTLPPGPRAGSFTAFGPITVQSGQTVSGKQIHTTGDTPCIVVPAGVTNFTIEDNDLDNGAGAAQPGAGNDAGGTAP